MGQSPQSSKTTILYCLPWELHHLGGVNQVVAGLLRETARHPDLQAKLLVMDATAPDIRREWEGGFANGYEIIRVNVRSVWNATRPWRNLLTIVFRWPGNFLRLMRLLRALRPQAVNVHFVGLHALTLLWALRCVAPARMILSFHGADLRDVASGGFVTRLLWRRLLDSVDGITCCSDSLSAELRAKHPTCKTVITIHNGIDGDYLRQALKSETPRVTPGRYIVNVATFEHKKAQDVLVRAWRSICDEFPDIALVLIGRDSPFLDDIRALIASLSLQRRVIVIPGLPHAAALTAIQHAELFALSSRDEPFGIVLLEAAFCGVPIVATRVGGVPEVLNDSNAVLVNSDDAQALSAALARVLRDAPLRDRLVSKARREVAERFTWAATFERYLTFLLGAGPKA